MVLVHIGLVVVHSPQVVVLHSRQVVVLVRHYSPRVPIHTIARVTSILESPPSFLGDTYHSSRSWELDLAQVLNTTTTEAPEQTVSREEVPWAKDIPSSLYHGIDRSK